jgi:prepilin-type N-terminal cleavage/methylation domain-containing protein
MGKSKWWDSRGLTLIEVLSVFVILGILATFASPMFIGLQDQL